jgi:hypothetical protein
MKSYLAVAVGLLLLVAPLWTLSGFVTVPEYRTGTFADYQTAVVSALTLYGGVFLGVLIGECFKARRSRPVFRRIFVAGIIGAMVGATIGLIASLALELVSTGRLMLPGQTPALLPIFYIVGGILSALMAAGAGLIAYGLARPTR